MLLGSTRTITIITGGKQRMLETGRNDKNVKAKYTVQVRYVQRLDQLSWNRNKQYYIQSSSVYVKEHLAFPRTPSSPEIKPLAGFPHLMHMCFTRDSWPFLCTQLSASITAENNKTEKLLYLCYHVTRGLLKETLHIGDLKVTLRIDFHVWHTMKTIRRRNKEKTGLLTVE